MKITYEFVDGTKNEVEVEEEIGTVIMDSRRKEHADDERQRYHCYSYNAIDYEGMEYADLHTPKTELERKELHDELQEVIDTLTDIQKRRLEMLLEGMSIRRISKVEEVDFSTVIESIKSIKKKFFKKF